MTNIEKGPDSRGGIAERLRKGPQLPEAPSDRMQENLLDTRRRVMDMLNKPVGAARPSEELEKAANKSDRGIATAAYALRTSNPRYARVNRAMLQDAFTYRERQIGRLCSMTGKRVPDLPSLETSEAGMQLRTRVYENAGTVDRFVRAHIAREQAVRDLVTAVKKTNPHSPVPLDLETATRAVTTIFSDDELLDVATQAKDGAKELEMRAKADERIIEQGNKKLVTEAFYNGAK